MYGAAAKWIEGLPTRWALGGLLLGIVWTGVSVLQGGAPRAGAWTTGLVSVLLLIVLPLGVLGFAWGWHERRAMREAQAEGSAIIDHRLRNEYHFVQAGKGAACGLAFGLIQFATGLADTRTGVAGLATTLAGPAVAGAAVGIVVGNVARWSLRRRLTHMRLG